MADTFPKYVNQLAQDEADNSTGPTSQRVQLYGWDTTNLQKVKLAVDPNGIFQPGGFSLPVYDYIAVTSATTTDTFVYKSGGAAGGTVATLTVTYTDSTKATLSSVAKT